MSSSRGALALVMLALLAPALLLAGCARNDATSPSPEMRALVSADAAQMMADIDAAETQDPSVGLSSNPYDYVSISPAFDRLVSRGEPALDAIVSEIESSPDDGLREYLLAIAGQRIAGEGGPADGGVSTGKGWAAAYRAAAED